MNEKEISLDFNNPRHSLFDFHDEFLDRRRLSGLDQEDYDILNSNQKPFSFVNQNNYF